MRLLDDDFSPHLRMDRTVVLVRSRLVKLEREFVVCAEHLRFESFVGACDRVLNVVPIHPRYCRSRRYRDVLRYEAEEIDQDFNLLRSHLPLLLVVLNILDFLADTLEVSFTHSSVQNQAGSNWLACNSLCFLNPIRARHWTGSYRC